MRETPVAAAATSSAATPVTAPAGASLTAVSTPTAASTVNDWLAALPSNPVTDFITGLLHLIRRTFFNQAPNAAPVQAMVRPSGQVWGFLAAADPEGDQIDYTVSTAPQYGTVSITKNGTYTYVPGADFTGTDSFTVTIDNPGFHINLFDLFADQHPKFTVTVNARPGFPAGAVFDTFDGSAGSMPNSSLWSAQTGAFLDDGLQTYTDFPDNVRLDGQGNLVIQARATDSGYTSARLITQGKLDMLYGTMTARIKFPAGQGIWPAFWMLGSTYSQATWNAPGPTGWPGCGEIDVMELINTGTTYYVTLHGPQGSTDYYGGVNGTGRVVGKSGPIPDLTADYHDYWVMRRENQIVIGVDDRMLAEFTPADLPPGGEWVFNRPMYAILQIAVGGPWPGPPDNTTPWPATMLVDSFSYTPLA